MRFLFEAVLLCIIAFCAWNGYKKGLVMCIGTILAIIISLYVGDLLGDTFSSEVQPVLRPFVSGYMNGTEGIITENANELLGTANAGLSVDEALAVNPDIRRELCIKSYENVGIYSSAAEKMADEAIALSEQNGDPLATSIVDAMCRNLSYSLIFILFFLITVIIITVIGNLFNLSFRIPGKEKLNTIGGAVAGAVIGMLICMIITWVLKFLGAVLPEEEMRRTLLTALFLKVNLLSAVLTI
ncbi:MAG: CvpA family protein [Oscillospiraceae bacterium]|nr:CvpA family protein [Oscillospiraceae bacterium]